MMYAPGEFHKREGKTMKRIGCLLLAALLALSAAVFAEEELLIEETIEGEEGFGTYETPEEPAEAPKGETATEEKAGTEEKEEKQEKQEKQ